LFYAVAINSSEGKIMATIEKRTTSEGNTTYRVKVRVKGFAPESASFDRLTDARDWGKKMESGSCLAST
jgi:hypothetical protein